MHGGPRMGLPPNVRTWVRVAGGRATIACMTDQTLTEERHSELAELLNDQQRLEAEHPKVADYLDKALPMAGTGNESQDGAFDLRLVHYMVGGNANTDNPYWDIVAPAVSEHDGRRVVNCKHPNGSGRLGFAEMMLQSVYAFAIPSPETVAWMSEFCGSRRLVEVGAGRGYWSALLAQAGIDVAAFDCEPPDQAGNIDFQPAAGQRDVWHPVRRCDEQLTEVDLGSDDVLFLCWPPGWGNPMASRALAKLEQAGGERLILIGTPRGGMTATDDFFDALEAGWQMESQDPQFVSWWNLSDVARAWVRR